MKKSKEEIQDRDKENDKKKGVDENDEEGKDT